jgi:hypothetical protein
MTRQVTLHAVSRAEKVIDEHPINNMPSSVGGGVLERPLYHVL